MTGKNVYGKIYSGKIGSLILVITFLAIFAPCPPICTANDSLPPGVTRVTLAEGSKYATPLTIINSGVPGPVAMIVGGVHGNEPAGFKAAGDFTSCSISRGVLLVLPQANKRADEQGVRMIKGEFDLNRSFPESSSEEPDNPLAAAIWDAVKTYKVQWLMDMHEGYDYFNNKSTSSVGQTLIYYPDDAIEPIAAEIVKSLNCDISGTYRDFHLARYPVSGSLARSTAEYLGVHSFIFETCDNPSLSTRVNYQRTAALMLIDALEMR